MTTQEQVRAANRRAYGQPIRMASDNDDEIGFLHASQESAEACAAANRSSVFHGLTCDVECIGEQWFTFIDVSPNSLRAYMDRYESGAA